MIIRSVHLQNYRCYEDQPVEFPTGLIGVVGNNGAGKTTLIEAIGWCLYGNVAARTKKEFIKRTQAGAGEDCKVVLELVLGSDTMRVERALRRANASGNASLYLNGSSRAEVNGMNEVSEYIARRTGMDHVAFFTSIFAKQKELNALSDLQAGERKKTIMRLLRIDKVDDVIAQIRADTRESNAKIDFLKPTLKDMNALLKEQKDLKNKKGQKINDMKITNSELSTLKKALTDEKKKFAIHEKKYKEYNKINTSLGKLESSATAKNEERQTVELDLASAKFSEKQLSDLKPDLMEFEKVSVKKNELDKIQLQHKDKMNIQNRIKSLQPKIVKRESENKSIISQLNAYIKLDKDLKNNKVLISKLEKQKERLDGSSNQLKGKIKNYEGRKKKLEVEFSKIKNLGKRSKCPTCKRPLGEHLDQITKHFTSEIGHYQRLVTNANKSRKALMTQISDIRSKIKTAKTLQDDIRSKISIRTKLQTSLKEGKKTLQSFKRELASLQLRAKKFANVSYNQNEHNSVNTEFTRLDKINKRSISLQADVKRIPVLEKRLVLFSSTIGELDNRIIARKEALIKIGFDEEAYQSSKVELQRVNDETGAKREDVAGLRGDLGRLTDSIKQSIMTIKEEKTKLLTIKTEAKKIEARSKLEQIMVDFKSDLIARIRPALAGRASELFRTMTKGKYPSMNLDDDYNLKIEDEGQEFGIDRFSGGEEDLANLCLRIAISQELSERSGGPRSNFIVLDEIFGSQDYERKGSILKALSELANQFKQILIITHIEDVKESLPFVLHVKEDGNGNIAIETEGNIVAPS